jgi:secondary thiamine-phosphate synthase enzyme
VQQDIINTLSRVIPQGRDYAHAEGNSDSHIKSSLLGSSLNIFIESGQLCLGTWQGIYFCESDGPRQREVWVKLVSSR